MSVWTRTLKATPPERQRAISSAKTTVERKSPPPVPGGKPEPQEPHLAEPAPEGRRNPPVLFPLPDVRHDLFFDKGADRPPQELVLGREESAHFVARSRSRARSSVRRILPLMVLGRSGTNSISRGYL